MKVWKIIPMAFGAIIISHIGCSNAEFGGNSGKKEVTTSKNGAKDNRNKSDSRGFPEAPNIRSPGWIGDKAMPGFVDLFNVGKKPIGNESDAGSSGSQNGGDTDNSPGQALLDEVDGVLWLPCDTKTSGTSADGANQGGVFENKFYGKADHKIRLSGEWCPKVSEQAEVSVLFVVDRSGSMALSLSEGPNDPTQQDGSCGRLKATETILTNLQNLKNTKVRAGLVTFSDGAKTVVPISSLKTFEEDISTSNLCNSDSAFALTNYEAAMEQAKLTLENIKGKKYVVFISDGSPTKANGTGISRQAAEERGLKAAEDLRGLNNLTMYTLFLGYKDSNGMIDPRGYLESVTGEKDNVSLVADAEDLVKVAGKLNLSGISQVFDAEAVLKNTNGESPVKIEKVENHPKDPGKYIWYSEAFTLIGKKGEASPNTLVVTAKTNTNESLKTTTKIDFYQQD